MKRIALVLLVLAACKTQDDKAAAPATGTATAAEAEGAAQQRASDRPSLPAPPSTGIPECDDYVVELDRFVACDKIEQPSKDAALRGLEAVRGEWKAIGMMPPEARAQTVAQCVDSVRAIKLALEAAGC